MKKSHATLGIGLSLFAGAGLASYLAGRRAVPSWTGTVRLSQLSSPVEVLRDEYGIPAIFAESEEDLFFVQGYLHASDRLFQMDLFRRVGYGQLSEIVGKLALGSDKLVRTLNFGKYADEEVSILDDSSRMALDRFTDGVNHYMTVNRRRLPIEFTLLRYKPKPWEPGHSLVFQRLMALGLCGNWESELARAEISARFGEDVLMMLDNDAEARPFPAQIGTEILGELATAAREASSLFGSGGDVGSNNWVIGPRRTKSHGAILANDPHLDLNLPSIWYESRLHSPTLSVRGWSVPGTPGIVLGHNGKVAWGFTNSDTDVQDLYFEDIDEASGTYADVGGARKEYETRTERIKVKGEPAHEFTVRSTRRGPLLTDAIDTHLKNPVSIRWDGIKPGRLHEAVFGMCRSHDWNSFRESVRLWTTPSQNIVYADVEGNIGFQLSGDMPIRGGGHGTVPYRGDDPNGEWIGTIPFDELPMAFNPTSERIVTANDKLVDDSYPHFLSCEWMNGYRGDRIRNLIDEHDEHTVDYSARIQTDVHSLAGEQLIPAMLELEPLPETGEGGEVLEALRAWDFELRPDDDGAICYRLFLRSLQEEVFGFLGELLPLFLGYSRFGMNGFWSLFGRSTPRLIHAIETDNKELLELGERIGATGDWQPYVSWQDLVSRAVDKAGWYLYHTDGRPPRATHGEVPPIARAFSGNMYYPDPSKSASGRPSSNGSSNGHRGTAKVDVNDAAEVVKVAKGVIGTALGKLRLSRGRNMHRIKFQHPLGMVAALSPILSRGPYSVGGDPDTVWQASQFNNPNNDSSMIGPSHRHVIDMSNVDGAKAVVPGGVSGHPASPNYADQIPIWRKGQVRPAPFSREAIERITVYRQRFES